MRKQWQSYWEEAGCNSLARTLSCEIEPAVLLSALIHLFFISTGGQAKRSDNNQDIKLASGTVVAPKYYWKAVCDPVAQASIVFVGENSVGEISEDQVQGCSGKMQKKKRGVVYCHSLQGAETTYAAEGFKLPPFGDNCNPSTKGTFMDSFLNGLA